MEMEEGKTMNVMVAIDDSDESFHCLRFGLDKILNRPSQVVTLVHVIEPMPRYAFATGHHIIESASKAQEDNAGRILSRAFEICQEKSVNPNARIMEGDPKDKICKAVEEMNIDLLLVGSRGLGQIKRALLGSVSDYCVHHATCPVMVVKPPPRG